MAEIILPKRPSADLIRRWRARMDFTQREAAAALGCSHRAYQSYETGTAIAPPYIGLAMSAVAQGIGSYER